MARFVAQPLLTPNLTIPMPQTQITTDAARDTEQCKIDTSYPGWFRALKPVDSMFQSWECVGWFKSRAEAEEALK